MSHGREKAITNPLSLSAMMAHDPLTSLPIFFSLATSFNWNCRRGRGRGIQENSLTRFPDILYVGWYHTLRLNTGVTIINARLLQENNEVFYKIQVNTNTQICNGKVTRNILYFVIHCNILLVLSSLYSTSLGKILQ